MGLHLEEVMSLGTATTHQCSMSSTQKRDPSQAGSIPTPMGLCQRDRERRGGWKVKKGEGHEGLHSGCAGGCPTGLEQGHPVGSLPQQMVRPPSAALSRAHTAAGDSGQLPKPGGFCSQRPRHRFARCHTGICHKQDGRLISSTDWGRRSRLPQR